MLNEFFLYVLEDLHRQQGLGALQFTSADPAFVKETVELVYPLIPATATAPEMPATRAFSRQLVAYIAAFLPTAPAPPPTARGAAAALGLRRQGVSRLRKRRMTREVQPSSRRGARRGAAAIMCHRQSWTC